MGCPPLVDTPRVFGWPYQELQALLLALRLQVLRYVETSSDKRALVLLLMHLLTVQRSFKTVVDSKKPQPRLLTACLALPTGCELKVISPPQGGGCLVVIQVGYGLIVGAHIGVR